MNIRFPLALLSACVLAACNPQQTNTPSGASSADNSSTTAASDVAIPKELDTDVKQISYVMGSQFGLQLAEIKKNGGEIDVKVFAQAIQDRLDGKTPKINEEQSQKIVAKFMDMMEANAKKLAQANIEKGEKFLADNKNKEGVKTTASGLQYKVNKEGNGATPKLGDGVFVEYTGKLIDGTEFDSTKAHGGEPLAVPMQENAGIIAGWIEGLQLMKEGGEYTLYVPAKLAYGEASNGAIPPNSVLVFEMKILNVEKNALKNTGNNKPSETKKEITAEKPEQSEKKEEVKEETAAEESKAASETESKDKKK